MAEGTGEEAGEVVACPSCGREVKQHSMIPVLGEGGGLAYLCVTCARQKVVTEPAAAAGPPGA